MAEVGKGNRVPINAMLIKASSIHEAWTLASLYYGKTRPHANLVDLAIEVTEVESKQLITITSVVIFLPAIQLFIPAVTRPLAPHWERIKKYSNVKSVELSIPTKIIQ